MAFVGIAIGSDVARLLAGIDVPGEKEPLDQYHLTLLHLGDSPPIGLIAKSVYAAFGVSSQTRPFSVSMTQVSSFPAGPGGKYPIILPVQSAKLNQMRASLAQAFDSHNIAYSKKHPEFKGHITLAYSDTDIKPRSIPEVTFMVSEIVIWGGDEGEDRVVIRLPLELTNPVPGLRVAARVQNP
jgi:2'-5' RNA ligase